MTLHACTPWPLAGMISHARMPVARSKSCTVTRCCAACPLLTCWRALGPSCVEAAMAAEPHWGVLWFAYDWFSAIRTDAVRQVRACPATCMQAACGPPQGCMVHAGRPIYC